MYLFIYWFESGRCDSQIEKKRASEVEERYDLGKYFWGLFSMSNNLSQNLPRPNNLVQIIFSYNKF